MLPPRPQNSQHPGGTTHPPAAVRRDGAGADAAGALENRNTEPPPERPPPAELPGGGSVKGVGSGVGGGSGGAGAAGARAGVGAHHTPASGRGASGDPADGVHLTYEGGGGVVAEVGPIEAFLARGGKLPVLLLTCNRAQLLEHTIEVRW